MKDWPRETSPLSVRMRRMMWHCNILFLISWFKKLRLFLLSVGRIWRLRKNLAKGLLGKVLLCSSLFNFQNLRDKKAEIKKKRKEKKEEEEGEEGEEERAVTKCMYAVKVLEISQKMKERNGVLAEEGENGVVGEEGKEKLSCEAGLQKDFLLEVYTMTGLLHPNIVRLVGLTHPLPLSQYPLKNEIHQNHAMVMELVGGGDLYHQANFMGLAISVHINNMIKAIWRLLWSMEPSLCWSKGFSAP